jgi:site-specific DNA-methyltransferase (adenine-specific)
LGEGILIDPFMGSGSTVAAAEAVGVCCIGIERYAEYYQMSRIAIPQLAALKKSTEKVDVKISTDSQKHQQLTLG